MDTVRNGIDHDDPTPLYHQLKRLIQQRIECGDLKPGDLLPTDRELEKQYNLSRITIRQALVELARAGYLSRGRGKGTSVAQPKYENERIDWLGGFLAGFRLQGHSCRIQALSVERVAAPHQVANLLRLPEGQGVIMTERLAFVDGEPVAFTTGYLAADAGLQIIPADLEQYISIYDYLEVRHNLRLLHGEKTLEAALVGEAEAPLLGLPPGAPVFLAQTLAYTAEDLPRLLVRTSYRGDRYQYHVALQLQPFKPNKP